MLKIRELIKKVRACKTAEEERSVINKESAEIRNASKDVNNPHKARDLIKAIYMQMMGYETSFMQLSCVNLLASKNFTEKRIAYSALSMVIDENSSILLLATGTIKKDLVGDNIDGIALALNAIGDVCTPDMCRELSSEVVSIIKTMDDPNIKKKAACAATHIIRKCPELVDSFLECVPSLLEDKTHSVCMTGIIFVLEILKNDPNFTIKIKKYHNMFVKYEKSLLSVSYSPEFDVNGITDPFLQARIIEIMAYTAKGSKVLSDELGDLFVSVQSITEASKQTGFALQYELVKTINKIESNPGMKSLSNTILGKFLSSKDLNLKYIALNTLKDVARYDIASVQKHRALILEFLKDPDISLQRRALDLIYIIVNANNLKQIVKECLKFLPNATEELKYELTAKLTQSLDQYSPSFKWEIDTIIRMIVLSSNKIYENTLATIINLIVKVKELSIYSSHKLFITLKNNIDNIALAKIAIYVIGEFCIDLVSNSIFGADNEEIVVTIEDIIALLKDCANKNKNESTVMEYLLNCLIKLSNRFPDKKKEIDTIIEGYDKSYFYEVQQRAVEYKVFDNIQNESLKQKVIENVPLLKEDGIKDKELVTEDTDDESTNDKTELKLKTAPVKNEIIQQSKEKGTVNVGIPSNIGDIISSINLKGDNDNKTSEINTTNTVNLLDLNNIFSASTPTVATDIPSIIPTTTPPVSTNTNDIFNLIDQTIPSVQQTQVPSQMKECFKNEDLSIYYIITPKDALNYDGVVYASNNSTNPIDNLKMNFMVLRFVNLKVLSTSGNHLEPNQSLGVKKDFTLTSNDKDKKIVMKIKLTYQARGVDCNQMITIDDFNTK